MLEELVAADAVLLLLRIPDYQYLLVLHLFDVLAAAVTTTPTDSCI